MNLIRYTAEMIDESMFYQFPKWLITYDIPNDAKLLYMLLYDRFRLSLQNGYIDEDNFVYQIFTRDEIENILRISHKKCVKLFKEIKAKGLIEEIRVGQGKPNRIYLTRPKIEKCKNDTSRNVEMKQQEVSKRHLNNNEISKNKVNNVVVDENKFRQAIEIEKARFVEANRSDVKANAAIEYVIDSFNCFGDSQINKINHFDEKDYIDLFRIALNIVDDDFTVKNVDNHKAYFSHEIKKHIKQAIC